MGKLTGNPTGRPPGQKPKLYVWADYDGVYITHATSLERARQRVIKQWYKTAPASPLGEDVMYPDCFDENPVLMPALVGGPWQHLF
jgi:hypothetical protein